MGRNKLTPPHAFCFGLISGHSGLRKDTFTPTLPPRANPNFLAGDDDGADRIFLFAQFLNVGKPYLLLVDGDEAVAGFFFWL